MFDRRLVRVAAAFALTAGIVAIAQPAFALSGVPDQTWKTNGKVFALAQSGNTMYVGGKFGQALSPGGQRETVSNIAAFNITTGAYISTFAATVANTGSTATPEVDALGVSSDDSTLYIGGTFDTVDGQPRQNFAAVDTATGTQLSPTVVVSPNQEVQVILVGPTLVYFGGAFTKVSGQDRGHLAAISQTDGTLNSTWVPTTAGGTDPCPSAYTGTNCGPTSNGGNGNVRSLAFAPDGNSIFVGGQYYYVNGVPRNTIARVTTTDGSLLDWRVPWNTIPSDSASSDPKHIGPNVVWAILPTATRVYVGWGRIPNGFSAVDYIPAASGITTWRWTDGTPGNAESLALSPDGTRLFVGGHFGTAVLDYKISSCGSSVYAHGLVSVNPANGAYYCDWFPQMAPFGGTSAPGSHVDPPNYYGGWAMQMTGTALFVGGYFTSISGVDQSGFTRFTLSGTPPPPPTPPSVTSFTPAQGPVGTSVTVTGSGFTGATSVSFGATPAASYTVDSDTQITVVVPGGFAHAPINVTTPGGSAKSATNFKVTAPPPTSPVGHVVHTRPRSGGHQRDGHRIPLHRSDERQLRSHSGRELHRGFRHTDHRGCAGRVRPRAHQRYDARWQREECHELQGDGCLAAGIWSTCVVAGGAKDAYSANRFEVWTPR